MKHSRANGGRRLPTADWFAASSLHPFVTVSGTILVLDLCWRMVVPFLPALCWAFALALISEPGYASCIEANEHAPATVALQDVCAGQNRDL
jgi:hypothetical protein